MALPNPRFEASYERLFGGDVAMAGRGDVFFRAFYRRFLGLPDVARLFAGVDMARQVEMLRKSLFILASYYVLGEVSPELKRIAAVHQRIGLSSRMFDDWMRCLLDTVAEFDPETDEATLLAWGWALAPGITYIRLAMDGGDP